MFNICLVLCYATFFEARSPSGSTTKKRLIFTAADSPQICITSKSQTTHENLPTMSACHVQSCITFVVCFSEIQVNAYGDCVRWNVIIAFSELTCDKVSSRTREGKINNRKTERETFSHSHS